MLTLNGKPYIIPTELELKEINPPVLLESWHGGRIINVMASYKDTFIISKEGAIDSWELEVPSHTKSLYELKMHYVLHVPDVKETIVKQPEIQDPYKNSGKYKGD